MRAKIDLHLHSYWSDGEFSPAELIKECKKLNLKTVSLTDHETAWGIEEAIKAGEEIGIRVIPGIEFSCDLEGKEYHILGYFIDGFGNLTTGYRNPELLEFLKEVGRRRRERFLKMIEKINKLGFFVDYSDAKKYAKGVLARPHLARAVIRNEKNAQKLNELQIDTTYERDFFRRYLTEGKEAYEDWERPDVFEIIGLIKKHGGIAVLAHPIWKSRSLKKFEKTAKRFQKAGLDGVEVFYTWHSRYRTKRLYQIAKELNLIVSAGSDFHSFAFNRYCKIFAWKGYGIKEKFEWLTLPTFDLPTQISKKFERVNKS